MQSKIRIGITAGLAALVLLAAGCATPSTPYQPMSASSRVEGGFSETRLGEGHYLVTFAGNTYTSRERVESYLLYRAAELTLQQHYDWFVITDREIEHRVDRQVRPDPYYRPWYIDDYYYWRPYWRYYRPSGGWQSWYPYYNDPFWADRVDVRRVERFEATADIQMGHGPMPATNVRAFDARDVISQIGPRVERSAS